MSASELADARTRLGRSIHEMASELGVHPDVYAAYEDGRDWLSRKQSQIVAWQLAAAERVEALAQSGLPNCVWLEQWEREEPPLDAKLERQTAYTERAETHFRTCDVCQARQRFVDERFPEMPPLPTPAWVRAFATMAAWIDRRPEWMRPAIYGAGILAGMTAFRAVFVLLAGPREPRILLMAFGAIVAASLAGAGGGVVYTLLGRPARRIPMVGPYLAGIIAVAGYMGCVMALLALLEGDGSTGSSGGTLFALGLVTFLFGPLVGHQLFRPAKSSAVDAAIPVKDALG